MAGTLAYRLNVTHIYQRRFDSASLAEALTSSHWYIITRRPSTKVLAGSVRLEDQILSADFATRTHPDNAVSVVTFGVDFRHLGSLSNFQVHADGAYFSVRMNEQLFHGDAWALASLLSGADAKIASQEVLYIGQAYGSDGSRNAWERTQNHKKLQRIYEDHIDSGYEIFVAPLSLERSQMISDDHIDDTEDGPSLTAYEEIFAASGGVLKKPAVDLIEHSLISYFVPPYNEKLVEWRASNPTDAMQKMRSVGFRLLHVHLSGWNGLARFHSAQAPSLIRSHFISQDIPPEPRQPVLRGIAAENLSGWRFEAMLAREGNEIFAGIAENSGTLLRAFGDEAPAVRKPPAVNIVGKTNSPQTPEWTSQNTQAHEEIRTRIISQREEERKSREPKIYSGETSYEPTTGKIAVGEYKDGEPMMWRLNDPVSGAVDSALIFGDPGMGKSTQLQLVMIQALQSGRFFIIPSDPSDQNNIRTSWSGVCPDRIIATNLEHTVANLETVQRMIDARRAANNYSGPSEEIPGILVAIDDADIALKNELGARLVSKIISVGGKVGVGALLVVSDISALKVDAKLMSYLVKCHNKSAFMPNGAWVIQDLNARYGQPRVRTLRDGVISFVVHHGKKNTTLGLIAASTTNNVTPAEAKSWCVEQLAARGIQLWDWHMVDEDPRSWWTADLLRGSRWFLRRHSDGWVIVKVLSNAPCTSGPDALNWAYSAINTRYEARLTPWHSGPTTGEEGIFTYYTDVRGELIAKDRSELVKEMLLRRY